jgi:hypothetical protein
LGGLTRKEVLDHCRQELPADMVPDVLEFRAALPRTSSGKIDRDLQRRDRPGRARRVRRVMSTKVLQGTSEGISLEAVINNHISKEFVRDPGLLPLGNATPLLETGILDSLNLLRLSHG